jgi:hypothetical protein
VGPGFFAVLGVPIAAGRDFRRDDRAGSPPVVIVSQSLAQRMFPNGDAVGRKFWWTDPVFGTAQPRRIVGIVPDIDDENLVPGAVLTVYHPLSQIGFAERLFVHSTGDPYALVPAVTRIVREISADQVVERAATLDDVRAQVLTPDRLNAFVLGVFAGVALLIAAIGVAGVLAFSVSARTRELGVRLAMGSTRGRLLRSVLSEGASLAAAGVAVGAVSVYAVARLSAGLATEVPLPGALPVACAAVVLSAAAILAALMPAARAARVDVMQALRSD